MTKIRFDGMAAATRRAARTTVLANLLTAVLAAVLTTASLSDCGVSRQVAQLHHPVRAGW